MMASCAPASSGQGSCTDLAKSQSWYVLFTTGMKLLYLMYTWTVPPFTSWPKYRHTSTHLNMTVKCYCSVVVSLRHAMYSALLHLLSCTLALTVNDWPFSGGSGLILT